MSILFIKYNHNFIDVRPEDFNGNKCCFPIVSIDRSNQVCGFYIEDGSEIALAFYTRDDAIRHIHTIQLLNMKAPMTGRPADRYILGRLISTSCRKKLLPPYDADYLTRYKLVMPGHDLLINCDAIDSAIGRNNHVAGREMYQVNIVNYSTTTVLMSSNLCSPYPTWDTLRNNMMAMKSELVTLKFSFSSSALPEINVVDPSGNHVHSNHLISVSLRPDECGTITVNFYMPGSSVDIIVKDGILLEPGNGIHKNDYIDKEAMKMEPKTTGTTIVDTFNIPEQVAKRLSELLVKQSIREKMLDQNIENPDKYEKMENMLVPIVAEIESLKNYITKECVPAEYRSDNFAWNYDGYEIDGCVVSIYKLI